MLRTWWRGLRCKHGPMAAWNLMLWGTLLAYTSMVHVPFAPSSPCDHPPLQRPDCLLGAAQWTREALAAFLASTLVRIRRLAGGERTHFGPGPRGELVSHDDHYSHLQATHGPAPHHHAKRCWLWAEGREKVY